MTARRAIFAGRVQGVGFRYSIKQIAAGFDVQGWVKNLNDGSVELQVMAYDEIELDAFFQDIDDSQLRSFIKEQEFEDIPPLEGISGFSILR